MKANETPIFSNEDNLIFDIRKMLLNDKRPRPEATAKYIPFSYKNGEAFLNAPYQIDRISSRKKVPSISVATSLIINTYTLQL